jgi:hypothetical protein
MFVPIDFHEAILHFQGSLSDATPNVFGIKRLLMK